MLHLDPYCPVSKIELAIVGHKISDRVLFTIEVRDMRPEFIFYEYRLTFDAYKMY